MAGSEKREEEDIKEGRETGRIRVKINIEKGKEGEEKGNTKNFSYVLRIKNQEERKHQKVMGKNKKGANLRGSRINKQTRRDTKNVAMNVGKFERKKRLGKGYKKHL